MNLPDAHMGLQLDIAAMNHRGSRGCRGTVQHHCSQLRCCSGSGEGGTALQWAQVTAMEFSPLAAGPGSRGSHRAETRLTVVSTKLLLECCSQKPHRAYKPQISEILLYIYIYIWDILYILSKRTENAAFHAGYREQPLKTMNHRITEVGKDL